MGGLSPNSGMSFSSGLWRTVQGLWSGASGLVTGFGGGAPPVDTFYYELEDGTGFYLLEDGTSFYLQESAP